MTVETYDIQELVNASGVARRTIYFYVQQGLLPPPNGAGLAAHYTEEHLLRLKLIPVLREQGLRLDEIREQFKQMNIEAMRAALSSPVAKPPAKPPTNFPAPLPRPGLPPQVIHEPSVWPEQGYRHYQLPGGIQLVVPEPLSAIDRQRVQQLLHAARQIFAGGHPPVYALDSHPQDPNDGGTPHA